MFRRFFQRNGRGKTPGSDGSGLGQEANLHEAGKTPDLHKVGQPDEPPDSVKQAAEILQQQQPQHEDDGVHRMAMRAGNQMLPDDPDEAMYAGDQGEHADIARNALQTGDFMRAIYHLGLALARDPMCDEWLALLDQWIAAVGLQALDLVPLYDEQYFATLQASQQLMSKGNTPTHRMEVIPIVSKNYHARVAVHAYILASQKRTKEAIALLLRLSQVKPDIPYVLWLLRWRDQPEFVDAFEPEKVVSVAAQLVKKHSGTYMFSAQARTEISRYLPLLHDAYTALSSEQTSQSFLPMAVMYSLALRKAGLFEEAAHVARALPVTSYHAQIALAMAENVLGNLDASVVAYQRALTILPDNVSARNDLGALFLSQGKLAESLACYEESVRLDPSDPCRDAFAYIAYLRYLQASPSEFKVWLERLETLVHSSGEAARRFLYFLEAPYIGVLPYAGEALINLMRGFTAESGTAKDKLKPGGKFDIGLSSLEAPSARLAVSRLLEAQGVSYKFGIADVLSSDPRQPLRPVEYQIWRYEEADPMEPAPAVPPPDPAVAEGIAAIAQIPYALDRWHVPARALGPRLGLSALQSLLGVMVHPPTTPPGWDEWDWIIGSKSPAHSRLLILILAGRVRAARPP